MNVSYPLLNQILSSNEIEEKDSTFICLMVNRLVKNIRENCVILCTLLNLHVFKSSFNISAKKSYKQIFKICWNEIKSLRFDEKNSFVIEIEGSEITFVDPNVMNIIKQIIDHLLTVLHTNELPIIDVKRSSFNRSEPSKNRIAKRIRFQSYILKKELPPNFYKDLKKNIDDGIFDKKCFFIDTFQDYYEYMDIILDALNAYPLINSIVVPKPKNNSYSYWIILGRFMSTNKTIVNLRFYESIKNGFYEFVSLITKNSFSRLENLSIYNSIFDSNFFFHLYKMVKVIKIKSLELRNGIDKEGFQTFITLAKRSNLFQIFKSLSFLDSYFLNFNDILYNFQNIQILNLSNSSINLSSFFFVLKDYQISKISKMNLSYNKFDSPFNEEIILPDNLYFLIMESVEWNSSSLKQLLLSINKSKNNNFVLDINQIIQNDEEWINYNKFLFDFKCQNIKVLYYEDNLIDNNFLNFLNNCNGLTNLDISGCFSDSSQYIKAFSNCIAMNMSITNLILKGKDIFLSKSLENIISGISKNNIIKSLDISNNRVGNYILKILYNLICLNHNIVEIKFDDNQITDKTLLKNFFLKLKSKKFFLKIYLPKHDLKNLMNAGLMTTSEIIELKEIVKNIHKKSEQKHISLDFTLENKDFNSCLPIRQNILYNSIKFAGSESNNSYLQSLEPENLNIFQSYISDEEWLSTVNQNITFDDELILNQMKEKYMVDNLLKMINNN